MASLARLIRVEIIFLIGGFTLIVFWKLLTGGVRLNGLLTAKAQNSQRVFSPGRAQLLVFTIFTGLEYLIQTLHDPSRLPRLPSTLVATMGGSQAIYLAGKAWSVFGRLIKGEV